MSNPERRAHDQLDATVAKDIAITVDVELCSYNISCMKERFRALDHALADKPNNQKAKIQRVPSTLQRNKISEECYEPRLVPIGPIHHGKPKYQAAEKFKLTLASLFIKCGPETKEVLFDKIIMKIEELRGCFDEDVIKGYQDVDLAWQLLVDGCAVLHHMYCTGDEEEYKKMKVKTDNIVFAQHDLFLLENQIPFQVLKLLTESNKEKWQKIIEKFISRNTMESLNHHEKQQDIFGEESPTHLLDLLRTRLLGSSVKKNEKYGSVDDWHSFRNIKELRETGIHLKSSKTRCLTDIHFSSCLFAYLHLPPITVDDSSGSMFLNLIAYEMCTDFQNDFEVTSYVCFLDTLIDYPSDVKELRSANILFNLLGSDEQVATLFNNLSEGLVPNPNIYKDVKGQIEHHYSSTMKTWAVQIYYKHFSTPWALVALLAALLALFLTGVQTWFSAFPHK